MSPTLRILILFSSALLAACGNGESAVLLTIDATPSIANVDHVRITVTNGAQTGPAVDIPLTGRPLAIPRGRPMTS